MRTVREVYKDVIHSKSPKEFFEKIPGELTEILAAVPALVLFSSVLLQLRLEFLTPTRYSTSFAFSRYIAVIAAALLLILCIGKKYINKRTLREFPRKNLPAVFFFVLIILMIVSTCINGFTPKALYGDWYRKESLFSFIIYFVIYYFCSSLIKKTEIKQVIIYYFVVVSLILDMTTLLTTYVLNDRTLFSEYVVGIFAQYNHYGYFLVIVIVLSAVLTVVEKNKGLKILAFLNFLTGCVTLMLNNTFGCFLACVIALIFCIIAISVVGRKFSLFSVGIFAAFWAIAFAVNFWQPTVLSNIISFANDVGSVASGAKDADQAGTGRWLLWRSTFGYIKERPLFGFGIEGIAARLQNDSGIYNTDRPHNEYLQYAVFFGIPAAIAYLGGVLSVFFSALINRLRLDVYTLAAVCAAFGYLVSALFGNTMHYTAPYLFIFLGLGFGLPEKKDAQEQ